MELMARRRSELELELKCAREKIDDLTEVISRLEQDLTARQVGRQLSEQIPEHRSISPASESQASEQQPGQHSSSDETPNHHDMETSFRVLKEQLRAKEGMAREVDKQQSLLHEVSSRLRLMAERVHSLVQPVRSSSPESGALALKEPENDLLSPNSSLHLVQVKAFEDNVDKLIELLDRLKKTEVKAKKRIAQLEKDYEVSWCRVVFL